MTSTCLWSAQLLSRSLCDYAYPIIGEVLVTTVSVDHVVQVLEPIWRSKTVTAKKVQSRIALVLDYAEAMAWRSGGNPARSKTVTIRLGNGGKRAVQHFKAIHYPQMPAFWKALAGVDSNAADVVRFMILTAVRPSEALGARWAQLEALLRRPG